MTPSPAPGSAPPLAIVGGGFVGLTTALTFTEMGHRVEIVEIDAARREALAGGSAPFFEPGLAEALASALATGLLTCSAEITRPPKAVFLCVGTPSLPDGRVDLSQVASAAERVAASLMRWPNEPATVVVKSTVPPGTSRSLVLPQLERLGPLGVQFGLASNPEFLREGSALADARRPDRIVVGSFDPLAASCLRDLYRSLSCPYVETTTPEASEAIKYVANAFLATKISFANQAGNVCERLGLDVDEIMRAVGMDTRIGPQFLRAGLGYGGSCFPKDVDAFIALSRELDVPSSLLEAVRDGNARQPLRAITLAQEIVGSLRGKKVALLGLSFKPHTSDVRETRALPIYEALLAEDAEVVCCDPVAGASFRALVGAPVNVLEDPREAIRGCDLAIVQGEWPQFRGIAPSEWRALMRRAAVVDGRRILDGVALREAGVEYRAVGDGRGIKR